MKVYAVVVTYNRKELLIKCLDALLTQTYELDRIILIDNASLDGTQQMLQKREYINRRQIDYRLMPYNLGGAGGFYEGIKVAYEQKADWIWIMDDDTIPSKDSLERLIEKEVYYPQTSFFASCVRGPMGEPMNVPNLDDRVTENGYGDWYKFLEMKLLKIKSATFVSILVNMHAVETCGLPCKELFIWGDDIEYTTRLTHYYGPAYLVGDSWVCHQRVNARALNILTEDNVNRLKNYHYLYRNSLILKALYEKKIKLFYTLFANIWTSICLLFSSQKGYCRFASIQKGIMEFIFQYHHFAKEIKRDIEIGLGKKEDREDNKM